MSTKDLKKFWLPLIFFLTSAMFLVFLIVPKFRQIKELKGKIEEQRKVVVSLQNRLAVLNSLSEADILEEKSLLEKAFLKGKEEYYKLVSTVNELAGENSVLIDSFEVILNKGESRDKTSKIGLKVSFNGSLKSLEKLINEAENVFPLLGIRFGGFKEILDNNNDLFLNGDLEFNSFYIDESKMVYKEGVTLSLLTDQEKKTIERMRERISLDIIQEEFGRGAPSYLNPVGVGKQNPFE